MASAQSLLGLVNQLQNMETCFTSILMEGAMKLSALSDAKIFILVETAEGRRFCGKRHLCDQYMKGGGLAPVGNDVEVDVDTDVTAIRERHFIPEPPPPPPVIHLNPLAPRDPLTPRVQTSAPSSSTSSSSSSKSRKRSSSSRHNNNNNNHSSSSISPSKKAKENQDVIHLKTEIAFDIPEDPQVLDDSSNVVHADGSNGDLFGRDDEGIEEVQLLGGVSENADGNLLGSLVDRPTDVDGGVAAEVSLVAYDESMPNLPEIPNDKLMALQSVAPADCLTKGTIGFKLLNSILYDLGKRIAHICCRRGFLDSKDPRAKAEFSSYFDAWSSEHLRHLMEQGLKIFDGNQNRSALGFMKYITRTNFNSTMKGFISVKRLS